MGAHIGKFYAIEQEQALPLNRRPVSTWYEVEDGYFDVLGARLVAGRFLDEGDVAFGDCAVNVSETLADLYGGPEAIVGKTMYTGHDGKRRCTVVGVVAGTNMGAVPVPSPVMMRATYVSRRISEPGEAETYLVRVRGDAGDAVAALTEWVDTTSGGQWELARMQAVEHAVADMREGSMGIVGMFGIVSTIALLFAGLGIYGIVAYGVTMRRGEHALRMVLGASRGRVALEVVARQVRATWPGLVLGVVVSVVATPLIAESLGRGPGGEMFLPIAFDLVSSLGALLIILGAVVVAALLPALRAGSIDPWGALREE
jgi:ABC-type antimicrobial peptide transport system permease subunit